MNVNGCERAASIPIQVEKLPSRKIFLFPYFVPWKEGSARVTEGGKPCRTSHRLTQL